MNMSEALSILQTAFLVLLKIAGPVLMIALIVGLIFSIIQDDTQIQEQTLSFVPKLLAIIAALIITGNFILNSLIEFTQSIFQTIGSL